MSEPKHPLLDMFIAKMGRWPTLSEAMLLGYICTGSDLMKKHTEELVALNRRVAELESRLAVSQANQSQEGG